MGKTKKIILSAICLFFVFFLVYAQAAEEDYSVVGRVKSFFREGKVKNFFSATQGYDNNVYLNPQRKSDTFSQMLLKSTLTSPLGKKIDGIAGYELMSLTYTDASHVNFMRTSLRSGADYKAKKGLKFYTNYYMDYTDYYMSGEDDFQDNRLDLGVKQNLPYKFFHGVSYELMYREYQERKTRIGPTEATSNNRQDVRNSLDYEVGRYLDKDLLKAKLQWYDNNSNEQYLDYYDYDSFKTTLSATHIFGDKLFLYLSYVRQFRYYTARPIISDATKKQRDRAYFVTTALYYKLNKSWNTGLSYTYRQNNSKEPTERYSGSMISLSGHYSF